MTEIEEYMKKMRTQTNYWSSYVDNKVFKRTTSGNIYTKTKHSEFITNNSSEADEALMKLKEINKAEYDHPKWKIKSSIQ